MAEHLFIPIVILRIVQEDPSGAACQICGDVPYLRAWMVRVNDRNLAYACGDCGDQLREKFPGA